MENEKLLKRLNELEAELEELKQSLEPSKKSTWIRRLEKFSRFLNSHWSLVTLILAGLTAVVAFIFYGVGPFESHRAISTTRELSGIYSTVGDDLLFRQEWDAAEDAYRTALEIDINNIQATYGLFKAQVFQPMEGQKYLLYQVADTKLDYLEEKFKDDYQTLFLRGYYQYYYQHDNVSAIDSFSRAIASVKKHNIQAAFLQVFYYSYRLDYLSAISSLSGANASDEIENAAGAYIMRGYVKQLQSDFEGGCMDYNAAIEKDPQNSFAHNNLGECYLRKGNFPEAIDHFWVAYENSPLLITLINLGDAYMFDGKTKDALDLQQAALELIDDPGLGENERLIGGEWIFNYMPINEADDISVNEIVTVSDITQKKVFIHYNLSFGYALNHKFEEATKEFHNANQLDSQKDYNAYFANQIQSLRNHVAMDEDVERWFETHQQMLTTD